MSGHVFLNDVCFCTEAEAVDNSIMVFHFIYTKHAPLLKCRRWFDLVLVLQTDNTVLWERLEKRGYSEKKIQENVQCEIMHVIAEEARESYNEDSVHVVPSNTVEDMERNVENLVNWVKSYKESHS